MDVQHPLPVAHNHDLDVSKTVLWHKQGNHSSACGHECMKGRREDVNPVFTWLPHDSEGGPAGDGTVMGLRPLAVALLCGMAHSTQRTRHELWSHNGLELLLQLLREEVRHPYNSLDLAPGICFVLTWHRWAP
jgi:hypothetical protein